MNYLFNNLIEVLSDALETWVQEQRHESYQAGVRRGRTIHLEEEQARRDKKSTEFKIGPDIED